MIKMKVPEKSSVVTEVYSDSVLQSLDQAKGEVTKLVSCAGRKMTKFSVHKIKDANRKDQHAVNTSDLYIIEVRVKPKSPKINSSIVSNIANKIRNNNSTKEEFDFEEDLYDIDLEEDLYDDDCDDDNDDQPITSQYPSDLREVVTGLVALNRNATALQISDIICLARNCERTNDFVERVKSIMKTL